nr:MAG TPA: hypothetical protein [Caudoviricetes sp.]
MERFAGPNAFDEHSDEHGIKMLDKAGSEEKGVHDSNHIQSFTQCKLLDVLGWVTYGEELDMTVLTA